MFRGKSAFDGGGGGEGALKAALCDIPVRQVEQSNITVLNGLELQSKSYKIP